MAPTGGIGKLGNRTFWATIPAALVWLAVSSNAVLAQDPEEEAIRQTSRILADAISRRIERSVAPAAVVEAAVAEEEAPLAEGVTAWTTGSYINVSDDDLPDFDLDLYQVVLGADKEIGNFFIGLSGSYSRGEFDSTVLGISTDGSSDTFAIGPYAAFVFHPNFFVQGLVGYTFTDTDNSTDSQTNGIYSEVSLNGVLAKDNWRLAGRGGYRLSYSDPDSGDDSTTNTYLVGGKVGYELENIQPYVQAQYEYVDPEDEASGFDNNNLYITAGLDVGILGSLGRSDGSCG